MAFGPLQVFAFGFPDTSGFEGRIADELVKLSDAGVITIVDALAVVADGDEVEILRVTDLDMEQRTELGAEAAESGGLGVVEAIGEEFIEELPDGSAALLLIIEHKWAVPLREAVVDAGGMLIGNQWIGAQDLVELGRALGIAADAEAAREADSQR